MLSELNNERRNLVSDLKLQAASRALREAADQLSFLNEMDGGIMSYAVRMIKPDPGIYRKLFDRYGIAAEESVFLDDSPANVETAEKLRMHGILVESQEQAKKELEELLRREAGT